MNFIEATGSYEAWLAQRIVILPDDLREKHELMRAAVFPFLRATFYRWAQLWPEVCPEFQRSPEVLAVGDLHVENFGTWRDEEGRLVWGINDFDEVCPMPWTVDLVRLAASAHLAADAGHLKMDHREICAAIVSGYQQALEAGGRPWVLGEKHEWLSELVDIPAPAAFWAKFHGLPAYKGKVPKDAQRGLEKMMPHPRVPYRLAHRVAGIGSRGRQRFVAIGEYEGAAICREAKALAPSAWLWARGGTAARKLNYQTAIDISVRAADPWVRLKDRWIVRRLAPDCTKIELACVPRDKEKSKLLQAMGWETANIHIGSGKNKAILKDLTARPENWLHQAAARMVKATTSDWNEWRSKKPARKSR
ncbi:MAG: DUF2252 domain-containing protein [Acidobacteriota bacterium]|nr:DUF2252 domain-containing protein [Acidobacteriota bacterium]